MVAGASPAVPRSDRDELDGLLLEIGHGNRAKFPAFYDRVAGPVFGLAYRLLRDSMMAEDVAQEALVKVWRTADRFDPARGSAMAYTMTITHNVAVDRVRSEQAGAHSRERLAALAPLASCDEVAEHVMGQADRDHVRRCLRSLTPLQRESITLAYYGGHTYPQVAHLLDAPLATIKTRMRDGLIRLRDCLDVGGFHAR